MIEGVLGTHFVVNKNWAMYMFQVTHATVLRIIIPAKLILSNTFQQAYLDLIAVDLDYFNIINPILMPTYKSRITWFDDNALIGTKITFLGNPSH